MKGNKTMSLLVLAISVLISCKSKTQNEAEKLAEGIIQTRTANTPGGIPTTSAGYSMIAKIDGKVWSATSFMPPERAGLIVGENNGETISLPYYDKKNFLALTKKKLGESHELAEMHLNDDVSLWTASKGEMELTKVDDNVAEGKFYFTAKGFQSDKTKDVTDGFFRILFK